MVCGLYSTVSPTESVFNPQLNTWIKIFYSLAVALNIITTSLMGYRIIKTHRKTAAYTGGRGRLMFVLRTLIESAALQLLVEIVLLTLYSNDINAQYILLESVTPIVVSCNTSSHDDDHSCSIDRELHSMLSHSESSSMHRMQLEALAVVTGIQRKLLVAFRCVGFRLILHEILKIRTMTMTLLLMRNDIGRVTCYLSINGMHDQETCLYKSSVSLICYLHTPLATQLHDTEIKRTSCLPLWEHSPHTSKNLQIPNFSDTGNLKVL